MKLRDYRFSFCRGCDICLENGGECVLPPDGADEFFGLLAEAVYPVFVAPVYFYALPGQFKALVDRSQKFWGKGRDFARAREAGAIMAAGRKRGEKLFEGSLLTLKWFLMPFGFRIGRRLLLRGLDQVGDIMPEHEDLARKLGERREIDV